MAADIPIQIWFMHTNWLKYYMGKTRRISVQLPMAIAWANRAAAAVDLYTGNASAAAERAFLAVAGAEEVGAPIEAALSRTLGGRALDSAHLRAVTVRPPYPAWA